MARIAAPAPAPIPITPQFKMIYTSIFWITMVCLGLATVLAIASMAIGKTNAAADQLMEACLTAFKMGFGAMIGLIGGKAL
jgi:hypothetical protein